MIDLSKERLTVPSWAFQEKRLSFVGPLFYKVLEPESNNLYQASILHFQIVVDLERASDLTTAACIAALRHFTSKKGCSKNLYSDKSTDSTVSQSELE